MSRVSLHQVCKSFHHTPVVRGIDLEVAEGQFCVILGPSGCGKSTLLKLVSGLEPVSSGTISLDGDEVTGLPPAARRVAMVFQSYALYPHMSAYDNMAFGLRLARSERREMAARIREVSRKLHIEHLLDRKPAQLSGGEQQRVAIGRAMVRNPRVFLLDEPLSNLDADLRDRMRLEFRQLHRELHATMLYVTHDQQEAMTLADHLVVMCDGRIEQQGPPLEIYRRPANLFVARFLGKPGINLLPGRISGTQSGSATVQLAGGESLEVPCPADAVSVDAAVTVGIRPEHVLLSPGTGTNVIRGTVSVMEQLGDHCLVHVDDQRGGGSLVSRVDSAASLQSGDAVSLTLAGERCLLFDNEGQVLPAPTA